MEEFVCLGGCALSETIEILQLLAIFLARANLSEGFSENSETKFLSEDSETQVYDNPDEPMILTVEASQENDMQLALVPQDVGNPDFWNQSKFEGFSTIGMEKEILKFFQNLRIKREKILTREMSENFKFERELKRLHFAVNYERGSSSRGKENSARYKKLVYL